MTEIFVHKDYTIVGFYRSLLEEAGIPCMIRNELTHHLMSEIPIPTFYPALCVMKDEDAERAVGILREFKKGEEGPTEDWECRACGETVPGSFGSCWKCEGVKVEQPSGSAP
jgi:hypothetical protein